MKLKEILPILYAENFIVNSVRSILSKTYFSIEEKEELLSLYGEIPVIRVRANGSYYTLVIVLD